MINYYQKETKHPSIYQARQYLKQHIVLGQFISATKESDESYGTTVTENYANYTVTYNYYNHNEVYVHYKKNQN
jgi:hypothetical protein